MTRKTSGNVRYISQHIGYVFQFATPGTQMPLKFFNWATYTLRIPKTIHLQPTSAMAPRLASPTPVTSLSNCARSTDCSCSEESEKTAPESQWQFLNPVLWSETNHIVHRHKQCTIVNMIIVHIKWSGTEPRTGCSTNFALSILGDIQSWHHAPSSQIFPTAHSCVFEVSGTGREIRSLGQPCFFSIFGLVTKAQLKIWV